MYSPEEIRSQLAAINEEITILERRIAGDALALSLLRPQIRLYIEQKALGAGQVRDEEAIHRRIEDNCRELINSRTAEKAELEYQLDYQLAKLPTAKVVWKGKKRDIGKLLRQKFRDHQIEGRNENDAIRKACLNYVDEDGKQMKGNDIIRNLQIADTEGNG